MDSEDARSVILLSIHPVYVDKIFEGSKKIELRRVQLPKSIEHVVIYATSPIQRVVGFFDVAKVHYGTPNSIWHTFGNIAGVHKKDYFKYYAGTNCAVGISIKRVHQLGFPMPLSSLGKQIKAPQSFRYLPSTVIHSLTRNINTLQRAA